MAPTEFIYFDLGNVICPFSHQLACQQMARVAGVPEERVREVLFEGTLQLEYEKGKLDSTGFYQAFCQQTQSEPPMAELLEAGSDIFTLNYRIIPLLTQLRSAMFPIGILSSTCEAHWDFICRKFPTIDKYFDLTVLSFEVKCTKPAPEIYHEAIRQAGVSAEKIFFTDDRMDNVQGAQNCGMDAVLFQDTHQLILDLSSRGLEVNL